MRRDNVSMVFSTVTWSYMLLFFSTYTECYGESFSRRRPSPESDIQNTKSHPSAFSIRTDHASRRDVDIRRWFLPCLRQKEETCHVAAARLLSLDVPDFHVKIAKETDKRK